VADFDPQSLAVSVLKNVTNARTGHRVEFEPTRWKTHLGQVLWRANCARCQFQLATAISCFRDAEFSLSRAGRSKAERCPYDD
jgi:hypothetical protein